MRTIVKAYKALFYLVTLALHFLLTGLPLVPVSPYSEGRGRGEISGYTKKRTSYTKNPFHETESSGARDVPN